MTIRPDDEVWPRDLLDAGGVGVEQEHGVLTVTLQRPESLNAQTPATWRALAHVGEHLPPTVRVVVLRGAGRSFSAGLDRAMLTASGVDGEPSLAALASMPPARVDQQIAEYQRAFTCWTGPDVISIAAVHGHAIGAGFQLALACDLMILADDARLAMREATLGLVPDLGGTLPLVRAVGYPRALEICVTGRFVAASEAVRIGLAQLVVPRAELDATVADLAAALTAPDAAVVRATTALLRGARDASPQQQLAAERAAQIGRLTALAGAAGK